LTEAAKATVAGADIVVIVGSTLDVYPAAELVKHVKESVPVYLINPNEVKYPGRRFTIIRETATAGMQKLKNMLSVKPAEASKSGKTNI
jgi:NAD-dependent deacetylase